MAYDLKYQSDFYNYFHKLVSVKIYKRDYGAHDPIMLRTVEVKIEVNFQDENTPVIGTGVKVNIINEGEFTSLEDLLTSKEKEFFCAIEYDSAVVFQGYSICDLNEQQFLPLSNITLQFTDYVRRLEKSYLTLISNINTRSCVLTIISSSLRLIVGGTDPIALYVNSTLFETTMTATADETMLEQLFVDNYVFYSSQLSYDALNKMEVHNFDDVYTVLNKILLPLGAFIYFSKNKWVIERQEDAMRAGNWVQILLYPSYVVPSSVPTLREEYNKQDDDFKYVEESQVLEYASGLQKLEIDLQDKEYDTFVFNDFDIDNFLPTVDGYPMSGLTLRQWYYYTSAELLKAGYAYRGIDSYIQWRYPASIDWNTSDGAFYGLYYPFRVQITMTEDAPTELNVSFKMTYGSPDGVILPFIEAGIRYGLVMNSGTYAGRILYINLDGELAISNGVALDMTLVSFEISDKVSGNRQWSVNQSYSFTEPGVRIAGTWNNNNLWQILGMPSILELTICFFPIRYKFDKGLGYFDRYDYYYEPINYLGDISVTITQPPILNKITYYVEEDFTNTETIAIDLYDFDNINFSNGFCVGTLPENSVKTKLWSSEQSDAQQPLMDIFARDRFRRYCRTIHKLKGRILHDGYMKPFSVFTDDNLMFNSEYQIKMLLQGYTWDLNNGIYDVEAVEYTEEDILLDETGESPMTIIPTGLMAQQPEAGEHMVVDWDEITGMDGYILQRSPYSYNPGYYNSSWYTIYTGANVTFNDDMQNEPAYALLPNASTISYRVCAYNGNGVSLYSAIVTATWYK